MCHRYESFTFKTECLTSFFKQNNVTVNLKRLIKRNTYYYISMYITELWPNTVISENLLSDISEISMSTLDQVQKLITQQMHHKLY